MRRLRKSKLPADTSLLTPTSPAELVQNLGLPPHSRDYRAAAATSTAIALSIGSPFYDTRDTSGGGTTVQKRDADWQTAYGAARMAVEMAKDSSDMFLPLKAVAGAVSALVKNYDVSVSSLQTERLLILCLLVAPANSG